MAKQVGRLGQAVKVASSTHVPASLRSKQGVIRASVSKGAQYRVAVPDLGTFALPGGWLKFL